MAAGQGLFVRLWGFGDETWQTGEPVFYESHMIYNNSPPGETREAPCPLHTGGRKHQQLQTDDIHEPENGSRRQNENNYFTSIITGTRAEIASCA